MPLSEVASLALRFWLGDLSFSCGGRWSGLCQACPSVQQEKAGAGRGDPGSPPPGPLTLILWKFTLQLAPAREGMKRSPCLLGEDTGELAGVRVRRISETCKRRGGRCFS